LPIFHGKSVTLVLVENVQDETKSTMHWTVCPGGSRMAAAGLTQVGVNLLRLQPGAWSSQRHWHTEEDEFGYVLEGEVTLVTDEGEEVLVARDCAGFKAGDPNGHHLQNRTRREAVVLEVNCPAGRRWTTPRFAGIFERHAAPSRSHAAGRSVDGRLRSAHVHGGRYRTNHRLERRRPHCPGLAGT
jgi:uncharacterized cupin superfamily protein